MKLFPGQKSKGLTVLTLCEKTKNSMSYWSAEIEKERDELLEHVSVSVCACDCVCESVCGVCV